MQDRLLQLIQIFQYLHYNIEFQLLITNKVFGDDVTLQYWSWLAHSTMGFDTSTLTQDCNNIGCFGIKTDCPIPMFQYGNLFTWAKYGYIILHPDLTCTVLSGLDKTHCKTIATFLQTDMRGIMNFQMQLHLQVEINLYVSSIFPKDMSCSQRPSHFDQFVATRIKLVSEMFSFLAKNANKATILLMLIFTNLFHQTFPKHCFLKSKLELLQQFYIAIEECVDNYKMFPGDQYLLSTKCMRCHNCISSKNQGIAELLLSAPTAILQHFEFLDVHDDNLDVQPMSFPLMHSSDKTYHALTHSFKQSLDRNDDVLHWPYFCTNVRNGEFKFCRAVKVDVSNVHAQQTKERNHKKNVLNNMSLVKVLFEDISLAINVWKKSKYEQLQVKDALDLCVTLFNATKPSNKGYHFCKHKGN
jgi:hypothetical protein